MNDQATTPAEKPSPSVWKRLFLASGLFVFLLTILAVVHDSFRRSRENYAIQNVLTKLDEADPGWRWDGIEQAWASIPDEHNSAKVVLASSRLLSTSMYKNQALSRLLSAQAPQLFDAKQMGLLERELIPLNPGVLEARKLADLPAGRYPLEYYRVSPFNFKHIEATGLAGTALRFDALYLAQLGKPREALLSCRAMLNVARSLADEPFVLSQTIRCNWVRHAAAAVERTLALTVPSLEDLADLQKLVEDEESHPGLLLAQRGNRAAAYARLDAMIKGTLRVQNALSERDPEIGWRVKYAGWTIRGDIRRGLPQLLELHNRAVEIARLPFHEQAVAEKHLTGEIILLAGRFRFFMQAWPHSEYLGLEVRDKVARARCLTVLLALERYQRAKASWPAKLEELTPDLLKAVPLDPFDGKPLRYKKLADGVIVYSVGPDGVDDGGKLDAFKGKANPGTDAGFRLWDVKHRRQPPPLGKAP